MFKLLLQLFGGRGAGSGNKGGHGVGGSAAGMKGSGTNGMLTVSDLVASGKTFNKDDEALYEKSGPTVHKIIDWLVEQKDKNDSRVQTVTFTHVNKDTGVVGIKIGWDDGHSTNKTFNTKKKK